MWACCCLGSFPGLKLRKPQPGPFPLLPPKQLAFSGPSLSSAPPGVLCSLSDAARASGSVPPGNTGSAVSGVPPFPAPVASKWVQEAPCPLGVLQFQGCQAERRGAGADVEGVEPRACEHKLRSQGPGVDCKQVPVLPCTAFKPMERKEHSPGKQGGPALAPAPPSCVTRHSLWKPQLPGALNGTVEPLRAFWWAREGIRKVLTHVSVFLEAQS